MANIKTYTNPIDKLTPDEKGYQAREMAGRRIGPLYTQAAHDIEEQGKLSAQLDTQAEKATALQVKALGDEEKGKGGGRSGGGHGGLLGGGATLRGEGGGRGGGSSDFGPGWADTAGEVVKAGYLATISHDHGTNGNQGKLVDTGALGAPLYTTGAADSTPTATGSYSQQLGEGLSGGEDMTPGQIAAQLKQGDALYTQDWQGRGISRSGDASQGIYGPIGGDTTINGVTVNGPGSGATPAPGSGFIAQTWDQISGLASQGWSAVSGAVSSGAATAAATPE